MNIPQRARELAELLAVYPGGDKFNLILAFAVEVERDALERAAQQCDRAALSWRNGAEAGATAVAFCNLAGGADGCATAIRALITTPTPEHPDPTVALARLFTTVALAKLFARHWQQIPYVMLFPDFVDELSELTTLGIEALRIAKENDHG